MVCVTWMEKIAGGYVAKGLSFDSEESYREWFDLAATNPNWNPHNLEVCRGKVATDDDYRTHGRG